MRPKGLPNSKSKEVGSEDTHEFVSKARIGVADGGPL